MNTCKCGIDARDCEYHGLEPEYWSKATYHAPPDPYRSPSTPDRQYPPELRQYQAWSSDKVWGPGNWHQCMCGNSMGRDERLCVDCKKIK